MMPLPPILALLAASTAAPVQQASAPVSPSAQARGYATVRLLEAAVVPMSADSPIIADQTRKTIRLADGEREAILVEFQ